VEASQEYGWVIVETIERFISQCWLYFVKQGLFIKTPCEEKFEDKWFLLKGNSAIFQLYHGENKLIFKEMMIKSALFQTNKLGWFVIALVHCNNSLRVDMSLHSDTLIWFRANQSLFLLLHAAWLAACIKTYFFLKKPTCVTVFKFESNAFHKIVPE
jgi:hypothetical protein